MQENNENLKTRTPREKKLTPFTKGAIIYGAVLALIFVILLCVLAAFLHTYETNLPEKTAEKFISELDGKALTKLVEDKLSSEGFGEFENAEAVLESAKHLSGEISFSKLVKEYTSDAPVYRIICGENDIGRLILKKSAKNAMFGLTRYEIDRAELYKEAVPGAEKRIDARLTLPAGASLSVNGIAVSDSYLTEKGVAYSGSAVLTAEYGESLCDIYLIENLCAAPRLDIEYNGDRFSVAGGQLSHGGSEYDWFADSSRTFVLTVPTGADVTVGGRIPSAPSRKGDLSHAVSEFEAHLGEKLPGTVSYTVCGDISGAEDEIKVSLGANVLSGRVNDTPSGKQLVYLYSEDSFYKVNAVLPEGAELFINGISVSEDYSEGASEFPSVSDIGYLINDKSVLMGRLYKIAGLLTEPEISASLDGEELMLCSATRDKQVITAEFFGAPAALPEASLAATDFAKAYFNYVINGAVGIEANYSALLEKMKSGSPGYKQIQQTKNSIKYVNRSAYRIDELKILSAIPLGEQLVWCRPEFSVNLKLGSKEKQYAGTMDLVLFRENDVFYVCDMLVDSN